jgi:hypothetical protein
MPADTTTISHSSDVPSANVNPVIAPASSCVTLFVIFER